MATGTGLALPEPLQDGDGRSWFKRYEAVCATANAWLTGCSEEAYAPPHAAQRPRLGHL